MKDEELERWLRNDPAEPGPRVEQELMRRYDAVYNRGMFWRRPVPLYQAAAMLAVVAGLALAAGRLSGPPKEPASVAAPPSVEAAWATAAPDILAGN